MKCPRCDSKMVDGVCIKCGYMKNGNIVNTDYENKKTDLEIYEKEYDDMLHNKHILKPFLLGSFYVGYKGHLIAGILLGGIESLCFYFCYRFFEGFAFNYKMVFGLIFTFMVWILIRLILAGVLNSLVLYLDKINIKKIQELKDYKVILAYHKSTSLFLLILNILICIVCLGFVIVLV